MSNETTLRPLPHAVYRAVGLPAATAGIEALARVVSEPAGAARKSALRDLAEVLASGSVSPGSIELALVRRVRVISRYDHFREGSWSYGNYQQRKEIIDELLATAREQRDKPEDAQQFARAAALLAAQEGFLLGGPMLVRITSDPDFAGLTKWPDPVLAELRSLVQQHKVQTRSIATRLVAVCQTLQSLMDEPEPNLNKDQVHLFITRNEELLVEARSRPEFQWRVANLTWMLVNVARARDQHQVLDLLRSAAARWRSLADEPEFARWIDEAFKTPWIPSRTAGLRVLTAEEYQARCI